MKKMLMCLLVACMLMTALPVSAEDYSCIGWEVSAQVDQDHFGYLLQSLLMNAGEEGTDEMLEGADAFVTFVNNIVIRGEAGPNALLAQLYMKEQPLMDFAVGQDENGGLMFDTSLLSGYLLTVPVEKMQQIQAQLGSMMQPRTAEEMAAAGMQFVLGMNALCDEIGADFEAKKVSDREENVVMNVQGMDCTFSHVTEYRMTGEDLFQGMKKMLNGVLPLLKDYLVGMGVPEEQITITLSDDELAEDDPFARAQIHLTHYANDTALSVLPLPELWTAEMTMDGETIYVEAMQQVPGAMGDDAFYLRVYQVMEGEEISMLSLNTECTRTEEENYFVATLDMMGTVYVLDKHQYPRMDGGRDTDVRLYLNNPDAPLGQLKLCWWPLEKAPVIYQEEGVQLIDVLEPMDETAVASLETALQNGAMDVLIQVIMLMPEETEILMNVMTQMQQ